MKTVLAPLFTLAVAIACTPSRPEARPSEETGGALVAVEFAIGGVT